MAADRTDAPSELAKVSEHIRVEAAGATAPSNYFTVPASATQPQRIDQSEIGAAGNCQSACLAMLLGLPLSEVPNFLDLPGADSDDLVSFKAQQEWLNARGWGLVTVSARGPFFRRLFSKGYALVGGKSPRGFPHSVIYKDGELWHDPHPERGGVVEIEEVDVLYPLRPFAVSETPRGDTAKNPDLSAEELKDLQPAVMKMLREASANYPCLDESEFLNQVECLFNMARAAHGGRSNG